MIRWHGACTFVHFSLPLPPHSIGTVNEWVAVEKFTLSECTTLVALILHFNNTSASNQPTHHPETVGILTTNDYFNGFIHAHSSSSISSITTPSTSITLHYLAKLRLSHCNTHTNLFERLLYSSQQKSVDFSNTAGDFLKRNKTCFKRTVGSAHLHSPGHTSSLRVFASSVAKPSHWTSKYINTSSTLHLHD